MLDNGKTMDAIRADIDALRERFPRTADLYREACAVMFFRYGQTPTANSLYQLVRKGSMSVPSEALRQFWSDLRERTRVELQHADLPEQLKQSAGKLVGEIWSLARDAAEESISILRQSAGIERDAALAENIRLENETRQLAALLEEARAQAQLSEATAGKQREELSASAAIQRETSSRLAETRAEAERLQHEIKTMRTEHTAEIDKITARVLQAEQRYMDLEKRTLMELDRERTAVAKLQKQLEAERRASASKIDEMRVQLQATQVQLARQGQELGGYMAKAELLSDERDRSAQLAVESARQSAELDVELAAERARVVELRDQLARLAETSKPSTRQQRSASAGPRKRHRTSTKSGE